MTPVHPFPVLAFQVLRIIVHEKIVVDGVVDVAVPYASANVRRVADGNFDEWPRRLIEVMVAAALKGGRP